ASDGKEHRLAVALEVDVEAKRAVLRYGDERRAIFRRQRREDGIARVRGLLVREVDARQQVLQEAAREDVGGDVRRLAAPARTGDCAGLDGHELEPSGGVGAAAAEAAEAGAAVATVLAGLPDLDDGVVDRLA